MDRLIRPDRLLGGMSRNDWIMGKKESRDYVRCALCGFPSRDLTNHVSRTHGWSAKDYNMSYPLRCESFLAEIAQRVSGKNNPAYQHGGKFSPFSDKFIGKATKRQAIASMKATKKAEPQNNCARIEYWLEKTNGDATEAARMLSESQATFSLEKCVARHGEEKGRRVWQERQDRWQETLRSKPPEEIARINRLKMITGPISKIETRFVEMIRARVSDIQTQLSLVTETKKGYVYDIERKKKIIEFNGDFWHARPGRFAAEQPAQWSRKDGRKLTAQEVWERDRLKHEAARSQGYEVMVVWEGDFKTDPDQTVQRAIDFLTS